MRCKTVGIDFHSTLVNFNTPYWVEANRRMKFKKQILKAPTDYNLGCYHKKVQVVMRNLFQDATYMMDIKIAKFSQLFIQWLINRNNKIRFITATPEPLRDRVEAFIRNNFDAVDPDIIFVEIGESKREHFKDLTYWVDDNPYDCLAAYKMGLYTFMVSNDFTPWNKDFNHSHIIKIKSLYGVIEHFKGV